MDSQKGKLSTTNPTTTVKELSDIVKLALMNESINRLDSDEVEAMSKELEKQSLVTIEEEKKALHFEKASPVEAAMEADILTRRVLRNNRLRRNGVM